MSHTWLPLAIVILGIIRHEDSGAAFEQKKSHLGTYWEKRLKKVMSDAIIMILRYTPVKHI